MLSFLTHGVEHFNQQRRGHYPLESDISYYDEVDTFEGKITKVLQNDEGKTIHIDNAYKFTIIADKIRNESSELWTRLKKGTFITFIATLVGGITGIAAAIALGVIFPNFIIGAVIIGIVALAVFGFSFFARHRSNQADNELALWDDPTSSYIQQCKQHFSQKQEAKAIAQLEQEKLELSQPYQKIKADLESKVKELVDKIKDDEHVSKPSNWELDELDEKIKETSDSISKLDEQILDYQKKIQSEMDSEKKKQIVSELEGKTKAKIILEESKNFHLSRQKKELHKANYILQIQKFQNRTALVGTISELIKLHLSLKTIFKHTAYSILEPYFDEIPELKKVISNT